MRIKSIFIATSILCMSLVTGCATVQPARILASVDSLAQIDAYAKNRYLLLPGGKDVDVGDLQFQEFAVYIEKLLSEKGFVKASAFPDADVAIFLTYAIGDPHTYQYSYSVPTWGQTGVSSARTQGTVSSYGSMTTYSGRTTYTPAYGITGSSTRIGTNTVFTRFLLLDAYDVATYLKENKMSQVWKTDVVSTGSNGDLRLVVPYMIAAIKPYLATNTGRKIETSVSLDDPFVQHLRGGQHTATK